MALQFNSLNDVNFLKLAANTKKLSEKDTVDSSGRTWKVFNFERKISSGKAVMLAIKVIALAFITFFTILASKSIRQDWTKAITGKEVIEVRVPSPIADPPKKPKGNPSPIVDPSKKPKGKPSPIIDPSKKPKGNPSPAPVEVPKGAVPKGKTPFKVNAVNNYPTPPINDKPFLAEVFKDTKNAYTNGYRLNGKTIAINNQPIVQGTKLYDNLGMLPPVDVPFKTKFSVVKDDTLNVLLQMKAQGENPVGINMANAHTRGGGVDHGSRAQEEAISRRSNYMKIRDIPKIDTVKLNTEVIYSPHVTVFREDDAKGFAFMEKPVDVALTAVAAYNLGNEKTRTALGIPDGAIDPNQLLKNEAYTTGTKDRIRNMLRAMSLNGHTSLVLGALGCGAFLNPPMAVVQLFYEVLTEEEMKGRFEKVVFAILEKRPEDKANVKGFEQLVHFLK